MKHIQLIICIAERDRLDQPVSNCMCYYFDDEHGNTAGLWALMLF